MRGRRGFAEVSKYFGFAIALVFLISMITITYKMQISAVKNSYDFSDRTLGAALNQSAATLHLMSYDRNREFGEMDSSTYTKVFPDGKCRVDSVIRGSERIFFYAENVNSCGSPNRGGNPDKKYREELRESGVLGALTVHEGGDQNSRWIKIGYG